VKAEKLGVSGWRGKNRTGQRESIEKKKFCVRRIQGKVNRDIKGASTGREEKINRKEKRGETF